MIIRHHHPVHQQKFNQIYLIGMYLNYQQTIQKIVESAIMQCNSFSIGLTTKNSFSNIYENYIAYKCQVLHVTLFYLKEKTILASKLSFNCNNSNMQIQIYMQLSELVHELILIKCVPDYTFQSAQTMYGNRINHQSSLINSAFINAFN